MKKMIIGFSLVALAILFVAKPAFINWMMSVPETAFDETPLPSAPDYSQHAYWAALPDQVDSADWVPHNSGFQDQQRNASVDVFFVYPTAAFYGDMWVAGFDNWLHRVAVDYGILPQHASAFNGIGKIYAPRYRSVRMPIWNAKDKVSIQKATNVAYQDVRLAFEYYLQHWNTNADGSKRPFIIVSHSQ